MEGPFEEGDQVRGEVGAGVTAYFPKRSGRRAPSPVPLPASA